MIALTAGFLILASAQWPWGPYRPGYEPQPSPKPSPATVRCINAMPEEERYILSVGPYTRVIPYGQRSEYLTLEGRQVTLGLSNLYRERVANDVIAQIQPGYPHTILFVGTPSVSGTFEALVLRDSTAGPPTKSQAQFQFLNALVTKETVSIYLNGKPWSGAEKLEYGKPSKMLGISPRECEIEVRYASGTVLYRTNFTAQGGIRYTGVVMGMPGIVGNRAPRLFFYPF